MLNPITILDPDLKAGRSALMDSGSSRGPVEAARLGLATLSGVEDRVLITVSEAARRLDTYPNAINRWIAKGELEASELREEAFALWTPNRSRP